MRWKEKKVRRYVHDAEEYIDDVYIEPYDGPRYSVSEEDDEDLETSEEMVLTFSVSDEALGGDYTVTVALKDGKPGNFANEDEQPVNVTFVPGTVSLPRPIPFTDVTNEDYFYDAVCWAYQSDPRITAGTSDVTFSPNAACTRAQIVTFLWRAAGSPEATITDCSFTDVFETAYYYNAVLWAVEKGITVGTSESSFSPNSKCTRAQAVTFLWRFANSPLPEDPTSPFDDVQDSNIWYYKAILWAAENHITVGTTPNTFSPGNVCNRAQIITFLYRYFEG